MSSVVVARRQGARVVGAALVAVVLAIGGGCGPEGEVEINPDQRAVQTVELGFDHEMVVPTSVLRIDLKNSERLLAHRAEVEITGQVGGEGFDEVFEAEVLRTGEVGSLYVRLPVDAGLWAAVGPRPRAQFVGGMRVRAFDELGQVASGTLDSLNLQFDGELAPQVNLGAVSEAHLAEQIEVTGAGVLRPEEGQTVAVIDQGAMSFDDGSTRDLAGAELPVVWTGSRQQGGMLIDPAALGVRIGDLTGSLRFVNRYVGDREAEGAARLVGGRQLEGNTQASIQIGLKRSFIAGLRNADGQPEASRGELITIYGRGLVPNDSVGGYGMTLRIDGTFTPDDTGERAMDLSGLQRPPDRVLSEEEVELAIWYEIKKEQRGALLKRWLEGLGAQPGMFDGSITPVFYDNFGGQEEGVPWQGTFRVKPTRQVIWVKFLPAFSRGLEKYGLRNVELEIRARILEVCHTAYEGLHVEFRDREPEDFVDYAVIEISGPDPYGRNTFGYDNTFNDVAKDTGNLYLADYIGGVNIDSSTEFDAPFGGVFIESFDYFSPTLTPDSPMGSAQFDATIGPFMRKLGGEPVKATEWPDGPRSAQIQAAIMLVGNVVGNTVSHEIGHSMGLAFFYQDLSNPGNTFHNQQPADNQMMDAGSDRPFDERAELNGMGPARFNDRNLQYLKSTLPLP